MPAVNIGRENTCEHMSKSMLVTVQRWQDTVAREKKHSLLVYRSSEVLLDINVSANFTK